MKRTAGERPLSRAAGEGQGGGPADGEPAWVHPSRARRWSLMTLGWAAVALGVVGIFLPLLPTTPLLLLAAWAFANSSERFHLWLYHHPRLGPPVQAWHAYGVVPPRAKALAVSMMALSWLGMTFFVFDGWVLPAIVGGVLATVAAWLLTRPSRPPPAAA